jgi:urease accessory protein
VGDADDAFLGALQLADPGLPIGRFVHSHGLESWLVDRPGAGEHQITALAGAVVCEGVAPLDGVAVALAHRARTLEELVALDRSLTARKTVASARLASESCGRQLALLAPRLTDDSLVHELATGIRLATTPGNLAVVSGSLARALGIGERDAVLIELRGALSSLLSAALRLGRLGPLDAQIVIRRLAPSIAAAADDALRTPVEAMRSSAYELDVAALAHTRRDARTFAT